jgi:iron complex outermembrane receptor protein
LPETKIILNADLINNRHGFSLLGRYTSDYKTTRVLSSSAVELGYNQNIDEWLSIDSRYNYSFEVDENQMQFSLGIKNIFDEDAPQVYDAANFSYDPRQHDPRGRLTYIGLKLLR